MPDEEIVTSAAAPAVPANEEVAATSATPPAPAPTAAIPAGAQGEPVLKKGKILVVEDDPFLVKAYQIKFEKEGVEVWIANDGETALKFLEKDPPNVVLLDLMLPGINGFEILEEIRKNERWKDIPVFILTNLGQEQDMARGQALHIVDYIVKANTRIGDVVEKVNKYLG